MKPQNFKPKDRGVSTDASSLLIGFNEELERVEIGFVCRLSRDPATARFEQGPQSGKTGLRRRQGAPAPKSTYALI